LAGTLEISKHHSGNLFVKYGAQEESIRYSNREAPAEGFEKLFDKIHFESFGKIKSKVPGCLVQVYEDPR